MDIEQAIAQFKLEIRKRGHPSNIVWLQLNQMCLSKECLYIYTLNGFPYEKHIVKAYENLEGDLECGATLMLVCTTEDESYCTLLVDSFGSTEDIEFDEGFFFWCDPYVNNIEFVTSKFRWIYIAKLAKKTVLSSLDYAFSIEQSVT